MSDATSTSRGDSSDDDIENEAVLVQLRALAAHVDPVPPEALAAARSALAWRTLDAELAKLVADSSTDVAELALVRSAATPTLLSFESPSLAVEIEVLEVADLRRLLGQLVPPEPGTVTVRHGGGTVTVAADEVGRFSVADVARGPVSLRCQVGARVVETDWFLA